MRWLDDNSDSMDMILSKLQEIVEDRAWHATVHRVAKLEHYLVTEQQHKLQEGAGRSSPLP